MDYFSWLYILPAAFLLDWLLGDPRWLPHPICWMGKAISVLEPRFRRLPWGETLSGGVFAVVLIAGTWSTVFLSLKLLGAIHPALKIIVQILLIYFAISARSLQQMAMQVFEPLNQGDLEQAKSNVAQIVGRDVKELDSPGVSRASVETVAENLVDGVISPLFFAALGGAPLALAYKMTNTLDSMIGYKNDEYKYFGKVAARIDDVANYIPARISVVIISVAAQLKIKSGSSAFMTALKEGRRHSSPNAGYPEASFAGALQIKLGGPNYYFGNLVDKPYIGSVFKETIPEDIKKSCDLMLWSSCLMLVVACAATSVIYF